MVKTFKDFLDRVTSDEAFADEINTAAAEKREEAAKKVNEILIAVAKERGYEITEQELKEYMSSQVTELSEEEMGKVAGGTVIPVVTATIAIVSTVVATVLKTRDGEK